MQRFILLFLLSISLVACSQKKVIFDDYVASIKDYQHKMNREFSDPEESPLTEEDRKKFKNLDFFPIDSTYKVTANFVRTPNEKAFEMPTTTSSTNIEVKYAEAHFTLMGKKLKLSIYQSQSLKFEEQYKNYLFLPFTDITNGEETYGGGRYIDLEIPEGKTIIIDFNKAYNPYCTYNPSYSCPIPPEENDLAIAIKAGVKNYKK
ncbi:DUF1684 domain-containing protein [Aureibaculum conchae]|uniref:DUF1684 domain-containing protein n=1 Tax=Aureibaculum sp. 2308TA14-22 TaxID=3108392 RepID=UPI00339974FA